MAKNFDTCNGTIQLWNWSPRYGAPGAPGALGGPGECEKKTPTRNHWFQTLV